MTADPVTYGLMLVVALAYVGGAALVVAGLGKILLAWWAGWRAHTQAGAVDEALLEQAATAMAAVAAAAGVAPPATDVVAILGAPTGSGPHPMGDGGLAVTRFRAGRAATVVFAQAALTGLSSAALHSLAAHELLTAPTGVP